VSAQPGYSVDSLGRTEPAAAALCDVNVSYGYEDPAECNAPPAADKVCSGLQAMKLVHYPEYGRSQWECLYASPSRARVTVLFTVVRGFTHHGMTQSP
jgi:hypothetical protein